MGPSKNKWKTDSLRQSSLCVASGLVASSALLRVNLPGLMDLPEGAFMTTELFWRICLEANKRS